MEFHVATAPQTIYEDRDTSLHDYNISEVNISTFKQRFTSLLDFFSQVEILESGCFVQKYWSGTVTLGGFFLQK